MPTRRCCRARWLSPVESYAGRVSVWGEPLLTHCRELSGILGALRLDAETLAAGLMSGLPAVDPGAMQRLQQALGPQVAARVEGFARMGQIQALRVRDQRLEEGERAQLRSSRPRARCCWRWCRTCAWS